jgi:hypothetical protein
VADTGVTAPATGWRARWITWTLAGAGVAAAATGGVALIIREHEAGKWNDDNQCLNQQLVNQTRAEKCASTRRAIDTAQTVGVVSGIAAIGFGGAALVHWIATSSRSPDAAPPPQARTGCSPGFGSVVCYGTF